MAVERLQCGEREMDYHAMHLADHLCRYNFVRSICVGKRVLDVACGEGYGSFLLAQWGAKSVVGIDSSSDAIEKARSLFNCPNVDYIVGDASNLGNLIDLSSGFDLVCSFETIEHLDSPQALLYSFKELVANGACVAISAPNDFISEGENLFHKQKYKIASLKQECETILGPADQWLLGVPFQGFLLLDSEVHTSSDADFSRALEGRDFGALHLLPPQSNLSISSDDAAFWMGVWGQIDERVAVAAPLSMKGFLEPWQTISNLQQQVGSVEARRASEVRRLEAIIAEERRAALFVRQRLADLQKKTSIDQQTIKAIAMEVWFEKQRWGLPYKIGKWLRSFANG